MTFQLPHTPFILHLMNHLVKVKKTKEKKNPKVGQKQKEKKKNEHVGGGEKKDWAAFPMLWG